MDGYAIKKEKLNHLRKKIERMSDNKKKSELIDGYYALLAFLKEVDEIDTKDYRSYDLYQEDLNKYDKRVQQDTQKKIDELYDSAGYIKEVCQKVIDEYKKADFCSFEYTIYNKVNLEKMSKMLKQFFLSLGNDVYKLYERMTKSDSISMTNYGNCVGCSYNSITVDDPTIILQDIDYNLDFYFTMAHEMGHCYQFYLQRNQHFLSSFNIFDEVGSILFEKLFREFLAKNKAYDKDVYAYDLETNLYFLNDASATKILCELIENGEISSINSFDLDYVTSVPHEELLKRMASDCGYIFANKIDINIEEVLYFVGEMIANYFIKRMKEDFNLGWKEFKNFVCTANYLPLDEVLHQYLDVDLVNDKTKKFIKSYRGR